MPALIQYFVSSLGRDAASCADLMSYLLFTSRYTRDLIAIVTMTLATNRGMRRLFSIRPRGDAEIPLAGVTGGT